jgi:tyrosinase
LKFKLLVFISDWSEDEVPMWKYSISFRGAEGPSEKYPDSKLMGYPLDRPFKNNSYKEVRKFENLFEILLWRRN